MEIIIEHVRSFAERQSIPICPLTLLVGENSSGKSTFLATAACVLDPVGFPAAPGFNIPPYSLGMYDSIATFKGGKYGRDKTFSIGFKVGELGARDRREVVATYEARRGSPFLRELRVATSFAKLAINVSERIVEGHVTLLGIGGYREETLSLSGDIGKSESEAPRFFWFGVLNAIFAKTQPLEKATADRAIEFIREIDEGLIPEEYRSYSMAPIRSKPKRTYDELSEEFSPEGDHVPRLLSTLFAPASVAEQRESQRVRAALAAFGEESGMFKNVDIKRLGKGPGDPFQIQVSVAGPPANLTDVGYGVSQALPIIVESEITSRSKLRLMQQPEVHLHPRAQAALGSFFARLAADGDRTFVIETHSDYLVDRVRQEVANGVLPADRVLILFFDKPALETTIYAIELDGAGNVVDPPPHYRRFFLEEDVNLLHRGS